MSTSEKEARLRYSAAEWQARLDLAAGYRIADMFGFSDIIWNHITLRVPGTEHFLIGRFGLRYDEITASSLLKLDIDGNVIDRGTAESDEDVNVTGFVIHSAILGAREDVNCVMHAHSPAGLAMAVLKDGLQPMILDALPIYPKVGYHAFEGMSVDQDERARLAESIGDNTALILKNHGLLTAGDSVGAAFMIMYYLERACEVQLKVLATGAPFEVISDGHVQAGAANLDVFPHGRFEWPALVRLAEQRCPDYRD